MVIPGLVLFTGLLYSVSVCHPFCANFGANWGCYSSKAPILAPIIEIPQHCLPSPPSDHILNCSLVCSTTLVCLELFAMKGPLLIRDQMLGMHALRKTAAGEP